MHFQLIQMLAGIYGRELSSLTNKHQSIPQQDCLTVLYICCIVLSDISIAALKSSCSFDMHICTLIYRSYQK